MAELKSGREGTVDVIGTHSGTDNENALSVSHAVFLYSNGTGQFRYQNTNNISTPSYCFLSMFNCVHAQTMHVGGGSSTIDYRYKHQQTDDGKVHVLIHS